MSPITALQDYIAGGHPQVCCCNRWERFAFSALVNAGRVYDLECSGEAGLLRGKDRSRYGTQTV